MNKSIVQTQDREERLHALIADYLDREATNQAPERATWLAAHPDVAEELRQFLDEHERLGRVGAPLRALVEPAGAAADAVTLAGTTEATGVNPAVVRQFGDYEVLREIARGGMGVVYKARQTSLSRPVALKMILAGQLATTTDVQRFQAEASAAGQLDHPNIVPIYEVGEREGQHFFSMKLIEGESLAQAIAANRWPRSTRNGQNAVVQMVARMARAVHYAHQRGILHRDLKPGNILLDDRGEPHVTDFGLAKRVGGDASLTNTGAVVGTPSYMPPEQASGKKQLTVAADVYSLGAIMYEMLTGQPPFRGDTALSILSQVCLDEPAAPKSLNADLDRDLSTICLRCLEKDPARRYPSAEALADDLERWQTGEPILARPSTAWERCVKWAKRRPAVAALVGVSAVSAAALLIVGLVFNAHLGFALGQVKEQQQQLNQVEKEIAQAKKDVVKEQTEAQIAGTRAQELLARANSLRLVAQSEVVRAEHSALALLLALEAAKLGPRSADQNNALVKALSECRETGPLLADHQGHGVRHVRWFADGRRVLTAAHDTVRIWDAVSGKKLVDIAGPHLAIASVAISPDDQWLALTFEKHYEHNVIEVDGRQERKGFVVTERVARVYNTQTGAETHVLRGHSNRVASVAYSRDSKRIVTAGWDATARIWDVQTGKELRVLNGHECQLAAAEFTASGHVLTSSAGFKPNRSDPDFDQVLKRYLPEAVDPPLPMPFKTIAGGASYSRSGGFIQGEDLFACLWDAETGAKIREFRTALRGERDFLRGACLDPSEKMLVATNFVGATVWDAETGKQMRTLNHLNQSAAPPVFSGDGKRVLVFFRVAVRIFDVQTGKELATLHTETDEFRFARFSPDPEGRYVLTTSEDRTARLWDAATGQELFSLRGHEQGVEVADFSPDGRRVITGSNDRTARIWNVEPQHTYERLIDKDSRNWWFGPRSKKPIDPKNVPRAIWSAKFSPDGKRVATGSFDGTLRLWDTNTGQLAATRRGYEKLGDPKLQDALAGEILLIAYNHDGTKFLTVSGDRIPRILGMKGEEVDNNAKPLPYSPVRVHDAGTGEELATLADHREGVRFAHFNPDGSRILTVADRQMAICMVMVDKNGIVRATGGSGVGNGTDATARIHDAKTGQQLHVFHGDWKEIYGACWDAKSERVCTIHGDADPHGWVTRRVMRVWDLKAGGAPKLLVEDKNNASSAAFSPDGRRLLTWYDTHVRQNTNSGQAQEARVWDLASGKVLFSLKGSAGAATFAAYSPDGKWIVTTAFGANSFSSSASLGIHGRIRDTYFADRTVRLWDAETGALASVLYGHERSAYHAAFSKDSRWLVTCSEDRTARVWDVATGKEFITLRGHEDAVKTAAFSPDAKTVLTTSWDGTARLWPVDPLPIAQSRTPRELTVEERERYEAK